MNKKIIALSILGTLAASNVSAANAEFFLTENTAAEIKNGVYTTIDGASFKEENGVSYISADTLAKLFGVSAADNKLTYNGKTTEYGGDDTVPLKSTLESLGFIVTYSPSLDSVFVSDMPAVITVDGEKIPYEQFKLLYDMNISSLVQSQNATDEIKTYLKEQIKNGLISMSELSNAAKKSGFDAVIDTQNTRAAVEEFKNLQKNVEQLNSSLYTTYANIAEKQELASAYAQVAYAAVTADDDEVNKYYEDNFVSAKHILIPLVNLETGEALSEKDSADAEKLANEILEKIGKGEDFDTLMNTYSKDTGLAAYPDGYTFTNGEMVESFEKSAFSLKEGEVSGLVTSPYGYHIIKRLPLKELSDDLKSNVENVIKATKYNEYITNITKDCVVEINEDAIAAME